MSKRLLVVPAAVLVAQVATAQQLPPVRSIGPVVATAAESFGEVVTVRDVGTGVFVNDIRNRRLVRFDSTLKSLTVVADTTAATANAYSGRMAGLIAYRGDSSLFVDAQSMSMLVIDADGRVARVMSVPRSHDAMMLANPMAGAPGFDASGRLVYRGMPFGRGMMHRGGPAGGPGSAGFTPPQPAESTAVVRVDLATRVVDTLAFVKIPKMKVDVQRDDNGRVSVNMVANPLPVVDEWAVLPDGSIGIVRGRDYHVDWIRPDGTRESTAKIPFEWRRLSDEDKVAFMDSVKAARERMAANAPATVTTSATPSGAAGSAAGGAPTEHRVTITAPMVGPGGPMGPNVNLVSPSELPDYMPPFFMGAVRADGEGRIWIRTNNTKGIAGMGPVYDVISAKGELVERVSVPKDRVIVGFGRGGVVYLAAREGNATRLERARVK